MMPTNLYVVLVGQFIKNIGGLPCAYVFMALFADGLDHVEWKSGIRCDGTAMSIYNIIAVAIVGVATSVFNAMISGAGYIPPELVSGKTIAFAQPEAVTNLITFAFVGLETITGLILAGLLVFLSVEKTIGRKQAKIREYQKAAAESRGEEWVAPEIQAEIDEKNFIEESEKIFAEELKVKCEKKGLNYEAELEKHNKQVAENSAKQAEKKRLADEKQATKLKKADEKKAVRLAKLTPEQLAAREEKARKRSERDEALWATELVKGEAYRAKIQAELAEKNAYNDKVRGVSMTKKKKVTIGVSSGVAILLVAVLLGLIFTGMYVGWGPFTGLFWNQEVKRVTKSYPYENNQKGIVFYGASNFRMWYEMTDDMPEYKVANCGFGGSTDKLMVEYADRLLYPYKPKIVFFQTGSNDYVEMKGSDEEKVSACMEYKKQMFSTFREKLPNAKFVIMSGLLLPGRSEYTDLTIKVNIALREYCETQDFMIFVDANQMTYDGESYKTDLFVKDGIHLNHTGQLKWRDEYIKPVIETLIATYPELEGVRN